MHNKVIISDQGAAFLEKGQMWMYANNLDSEIDTMENGCEADIETHDGKYLGTGYLSKKSHIPVRILTKDKDAVLDSAFFEKKSFTSASTFASSSNIS